MSLLVTALIASLSPDCGFHRFEVVDDYCWGLRPIGVRNTYDVVMSHDLCLVRVSLRGVAPDHASYLPVSSTLPYRTKPQPSLAWRIHGKTPFIKTIECHVGSIPEATDDPRPDAWMVGLLRSVPLAGLSGARKLDVSARTICVDLPPGNRWARPAARAAGP